LIATINVEDELENLICTETGSENKIEQEAAGKHFYHFFKNYIKLNIQIYFNIPKSIVCSKIAKTIFRDIILQLKCIFYLHIL